MQNSIDDVESTFESQISMEENEIKKVKKIDKDEK